jgi:hypothetical protein
MKKNSPEKMRGWRIPALVALGLAVLLTISGNDLQVGPARTLAATCVTNPVVTSTADSGAGTLREAILEACPGSTITFAVSGTITLTSGELDINENLTIQGPAANPLTVSGGGSALHVFNIGNLTPAVNVTLSGLKITEGNADAHGLDGAGVFYNGTGALTVTGCTISGNSAPEGTGGGVYNGQGTLNVTNSTISGNSDALGGGGVFNSGTATITNSTISGNSSGASGGGVSNTSTLNVTNSTISGNSGTIGGGILSLGAATITNSTISGNIATAFFGGGITSGGSITITNSTISGNIAASGSGGGVFNLGSASVKNTLIALNTASAGPDVSNVFISMGHNLIGKADGSSGFSNGVNGDQVGSIASPLNPKLGPLQNNGGPTETLALLSGSPAIDAGDDSVLGSPLFLTTDQRGPGFPRKSGAHVDIGAFEFQVFDTCLKDNSTGNLLQWNSTTGAYTFTRCSDGFTLTGTGTVALVNGDRTLTDSKSDRRVSAALNTGGRTGSATIYLMVAQGVWQLFQINDTNPSAVCQC